MSAFPNLPEDTPLAAPNGVTVHEPPPLHSLLEKAADSSRPMRVIVIGAGFSGIYLGIRIPEKLRNVELVIYEKNAGVGGTWYENRYLGCACDVPSHSYQYSFEPNHNWSSLYAPAPEIQAYLARVSKKYSADRFIKLSHQITECRWDETTAKWNVLVKNLITGESIQDQADVLISARGALNTPAWPNIEGLDTFEGEVMHSARWNQSYDWTDKRIGVIGSGSSSIQIVPSLQRLPGTHVTTFARSKTWISPPFGQSMWETYPFFNAKDKENKTDFSIPAELQARFAADPEFYRKFRLAVEEDGNGVHAVTIKGTPLQQGAKQKFAEHMKERLKDAPWIYDALLPDFSPGCRRLTPGPGYLEALTRPNVSFVTAPITHISPTAIHSVDPKTNETTAHMIDTLVCATGFHSSTAPPFPLLGANSLSLVDKWERRASAYLSHSVSGFPNLFLMMGPNSAIGSGSLTTMIENVGDYAVKLVRKMQKEGIARIEIKEEREGDWVDVVDGYFGGREVDGDGELGGTEKTVFSENCRSWYKNKGKPDGAIVGLWPGSCLHCIEAMRSPRWEDFEYVYADELEGQQQQQQPNGNGTMKTKTRPNRLAWLGNGWTTNGLEGKHLAWYLEKGFQKEIPVAPFPEENERWGVIPFSN